MSTDAKPTLLIVDDQPENLAVLSALLQPYYLVRAVRSGQQALRAVANKPRPDLVLLDVMMPEMDGLCRIGKIQGNAAYGGHSRDLHYRASHGGR